MSSKCWKIKCHIHSSVGTTHCDMTPLASSALYGVLMKNSVVVFQSISIDQE